MIKGAEIEKAIWDRCTTWEARGPLFLKDVTFTCRDMGEILGCVHDFFLLDDAYKRVEDRNKHVSVLEREAAPQMHGTRWAFL